MHHVRITFYWPTPMYHPKYTRSYINYWSNEFWAPKRWCQWTPKFIAAIINMWSSIYRMVCVSHFSFIFFSYNRMTDNVHTKTNLQKIFTFVKRSSLFIISWHWSQLTCVSDSFVYCTHKILQFIHNFHNSVSSINCSYYCSHHWWHH